MDHARKDLFPGISQFVSSCIDKWNPHPGTRRKDLACAAYTKRLAYDGQKTLRQLDVNTRAAVIEQHKLLSRLMEENKDTEYGKKYGFAEIRTANDFRARVPLTSYDNYEPYIKRMMGGEENVLCARSPQYYAMSSGSVGVPKYIPVSEDELKKYATYTTGMAFAVADEYYRNTTGKPLPTGLGLNTIELRLRETSSGVSRGSISGALIRSAKDIAPFLLCSPWEIISPDEEMDMNYLKSRLALGCRDLVFMDSVFMTGLVDLMDYIRSHYEMLCRDIYYGRINDDVNIPQKIRGLLTEQLVPDKERAKELMREFRAGFDTPIIPRIWPKMSWVGGIGTGSFFSYARKMHKYCGKSIPFNNLCYAASESFIAAARHMGDESYVLIPDGGFYEFIPAHSEDDSKTYLIDELEPGEDYEIIITNLSGLYRYRIHDVIRVTGYYNEAPLIRFLYRKNQLISIAGEKTNGEALRWAVSQFSCYTNVYAVDYSVYEDTDTSPGRYVLMMEPTHPVRKEQIPMLRDVLERMLMQANPAYGDLIRRKELAPLELVMLQQQTYQLYREVMTMRMGSSPNQLKPALIIDNPFKKKFFFGLREDYDGES